MNTEAAYKAIKAASQHSILPEPDHYLPMLRATTTALSSEPPELRPPNDAGKPGGLVRLHPDLSTIIVPDLHARRGFLMSLLESTPPDRFIAGTVSSLLAGGKVHEISPVDHAIPNRPAAHHANGIGVEQYLQHHLRVISGIALIGILLVQLRQIQSFNDHINNAGRMPFLKKAVLRYVYEKSLPLIVRTKVVPPFIDRRRIIQGKTLHIRLKRSLHCS